MQNSIKSKNYSIRETARIYNRKKKNQKSQITEDSLIGKSVKKLALDQNHQTSQKLVNDAKVKNNYKDCH
jgi:hypothetical protein